MSTESVGQRIARKLIEWQMATGKLITDYHGNIAPVIPEGKLSALIDAELTSQQEEDFIDIVFTNPPGPEGCVFVEVEDSQGRSIQIGKWVQRGSLWALRIPR